MGDETKPDGSTLPTPPHADEDVELTVVDRPPKEAQRDGDSDQEHERHEDYDGRGDVDDVDDVDERAAREREDGKYAADGLGKTLSAALAAGGSNFHLNEKNEIINSKGQSIGSLKDGVISMKKNTLEQHIQMLKEAGIKEVKVLPPGHPDSIKLESFMNKSLNEPRPGHFGHTLRPATEGEPTAPRTIPSAQEQPAPKPLSPVRSQAHRSGRR